MPRIQAFSCTHYNIQTFSDHGKTEKDNPGQLHLLLKQYATLQRSLLLFAIAALFTHQNQAKAQQTSDPLVAGGATVQFMRSWYTQVNAKNCC
jgi:hypothetical protein